MSRALYSKKFDKPYPMINNNKKNISECEYEIAQNLKIVFEDVFDSRKPTARRGSPDRFARAKTIGCRIDLI
jgi:hypothetical protein